MTLLLLLFLLFPATSYAALDPITSAVATGSHDDASARMQFYVDADAGSPANYVGSTALVSGRFSFSIPDKFKDAKPHLLYAYWVTAESSGELDGSPKPFTLAALPPPPPPPTPTPMGCTANTGASPPSQTCSVTITWQPGAVDATHGAATSFIVRRKDGTGPMTAVATVTTLSMQNVFNDTGNVTHSWDVIAVNSTGQSQPSVPASWTTPPLAAPPPPQNAAPMVNAGPDQTITLPAGVTLNGSVTDDGLPAGSVLSIRWSKVSGLGTVTFANAASATTTATFSSEGSYVLNLQASDGVATVSDDILIVVQPPAPLPPTNVIIITTDRAFKITRCKTDSCQTSVQVQKNTKLMINGSPR